MTESSDGNRSQTLGGILAGINVVEFAQNAAIPYCGRLLAGMGADVVKVEPPGGDAMRGQAQLAPGEAKAYAVINPGKRAMVLDLKNPGSIEVVDALFRWADVVLVAFKQSDLSRFGIDWDRAKTINPSLIHLTHTAFGPDGPDAEVGGYDALVQARSGAGFLMNRTRNGVPIATRPAVNDFGTGIASALGVVAALRHRDLTGEGQRVDSSLLGTAMALATPMVNRFDAADSEILAQLEEELAELRTSGADFEDQRELYERRIIPGAGAFRLYFRHYATADGLVSVAGLSLGLFQKFHEVTGLPQADTRQPHSPNFTAIVSAAEELFLTATTDEWIQKFRSAGYPCGPYNLPHQALDDEQVRANDLAVDIDHPRFGRYTTTGQPLRFSAAPNVDVGPSPGLGQHTQEVLLQIGFTPEEVALLLRAEIAAAGPDQDPDLD